MSDATAQHFHGNSRRRAAMLRSCPTCGALANKPCIGVRVRLRASLHRDRYDAAAGRRPA